MTVAAPRKLTLALVNDCLVLGLRAGEPGGDEWGGAVGGAAVFNDGGRGQVATSTFAVNVAEERRGRPD